MNPFIKAQWIWYSEKNESDDYGEFYTSINYTEGQAELYILADSNYAVYINGTLRTFGQYADYPYDKVYDKIHNDSCTCIFHGNDKEGKQGANKQINDKLESNRCH